MIIYCSFPQIVVQKLPNRRKQRTLRGTVHVTTARAVPVLGPFGDGLGTVWGTVSLATRQTPQIDDNTPARGRIMMLH